jgi:hypothetical protein
MGKAAEKESGTANWIGSYLHHHFPPLSEMRSSDISVQLAEIGPALSGQTRA